MAVSDNPRFSLVESVDEIIEAQANNNTKRKTSSDMAVLQEFLKTVKDEAREVENIPPAELNEYLSEFILSVKKKNTNDDYEPCTLKSFVSSFDRYLKSKDYGYSILKDAVFERTRKSLQAKQRDLKKKGKGNKPNASKALNEDQIKLLYEQKLLGTSSPESLLNTIWFNNTLHFGLRGCKEHREMCWGDVKLCQNERGEEYLEFSERQTKTRTGDNLRDVRKVAPKMFAVEESDKCPVAAYKFYATKRPNDMNGNEAPFYLATNTLSSCSTSEKPWFKRQPVGQNKLSTIMKTMSEKAALGSNITNHSGRKTMMQTLTNNNIPPTEIIQLSGHKNLQSVGNYSVVSESQQLNMSRTLSRLSSSSKNDEIVPLQPVNAPTSMESVQSKYGQQNLAIFQGTAIYGGSFLISVQSVNQSPKLESREKEENEGKKRKYKRLKVLSDSEESLE